MKYFNCSVYTIKYMFKRGRLGYCKWPRPFPPYCKCIRVLLMNIYHKTHIMWPLCRTYTLIYPRRQVPSLTVLLVLYVIFFSDRLMWQDEAFSEGKVVRMKSLSVLLIFRLFNLFIFHSFKTQGWFTLLRYTQQYCSTAIWRCTQVFTLINKLKLVFTVMMS